MTLKMLKETELLCEMCEAIYLMMYKNNGTEKKSESTDGYSVSYVTERADGVDKNSILEKKLYRIAQTYLEDTGLSVFGGVNAYEYRCYNL